jgi:hypothetical protein
MESRLKKIEDNVGITAVPKTLEEMSEAFCRGEYGPPADLFRVLIAGIDPGESVFPEEIIKHLSGIRKSHNPVAG